MKILSATISQISGIMILSLSLSLSVREMLVAICHRFQYTFFYLIFALYLQAFRGQKRNHKIGNNCLGGTTHFLTNNEKFNDFTF